MSYPHTQRFDGDARALLRWIAVAVALVGAAVASVLLFEQRTDTVVPQVQALAPELVVTPYDASTLPAAPAPDAGEPSPLEAFRPDVDTHAATF